MKMQNAIKQGHLLIFSLSVILLFCMVIAIGHGALYIAPFNVLKIILAPLDLLALDVPNQVAAISFIKL